MKNKNNIIVAGFIAVIGFTALVKGFMFLFIGCLLVSGMIIGGSKAIDLLAEEEAIASVLRAEQDILEGRVFKGDLRKILKKIK